jgi:dihydrofolate reductase
MRKVVFGINITADGYCGHEDMIADEELHKYFTRLLRDSSHIIFGRTTYQLMVPYWPDIAISQSEDEATNEFALVFNSLGIVVFSTTLKEAVGQNTRILNSNLEEEVLAMKNMPGKDISVGSLSIASQLSDCGLIDEYHFVVHPIVAGKGPRLFQNFESGKKLRLSLVSTQIFRSGSVALHYRKQAIVS